MCSIPTPATADHVLAHIALVHAIAKSMYRGSLELEDLVQEGMVSLIKAARQYNPAIGRPAPFLGQRIRWAMLDALERHQRQVVHLVQAGPAQLDVIDDGDAEPSFEVNEWLADLSERERRILEAWLGLGRPAQSKTEIAHAEGVSRPRIHQIVQAALAKVRERATCGR